MKQIVLGVMFTIVITFSYACDICGCAANAFSVGMLPNSKHHFVGLRSTFRWFESQPAPDGHGYRGVSSQFFTTTELFGRYKIGKRFQVQAFIPYVFNQKTDSITTNINGLGDVVALGNFVFIDNMDSLNRKIRHSGTVGLGVKAPTGQFFKLGFEEINMLPGTGSVDFIANVNYSIQFGNFGLQNESGFTYKMQNKYNYRFGNALSVSQLFFYRWDLTEDVKIIPQVGINYMHNWKDLKNGELSEDTFNGGDIYNGQINLVLLYRNFGFSGQVFIPVFQRLNHGYVNQKTMLRIGVNYFLNSKK
jgi:hypothetical protein